MQSHHTLQQRGVRTHRPGRQALITAGVDIGSLTAKAVVLQAPALTTAGRSIMPTGSLPAEAAERVLDAALEKAGLTRGDIDALVATGYGRIAVEQADWRITEISCHARGARHLLPGVRTVIDLGGQDAKVISLDDDGRPLDFEMNDRCAAGTGRFFELMSAALNVTLPEFGDIALQAQSPAPISNTCTVFAESEVIGLLAEGRSVAEIAAGLCESVARRVLQLANRLHVREPVVFCGGVAYNRGVLAALRRVMGMEVVVPEQPQLVGALGAALLAVERSQ